MAKVSINSAALLLESVARMGAGFVVSILLARNYGPEGLGLITTASAAVTITLGFSALGLSGVLVRELVEKHSTRGSIMLTVTLAKLFAGGVLLIALTASIWALSDEPNLINLILVMGVGYLFAGFDTVDALYNAEEQFVRLVSLRLTALSLSTAVKLGAIVFDWGLQYVALGYALDYALIYVLPTLDFIFRRRGGATDSDFRLGIAPNELATLLRRSWPVLISGGFAQLNLKVDTLLIAALASITNVGLYSAASRLSEAWSVLAMALVTATFPGLVKIARSDVGSYGLQLSKLLRHLIWLSIAGCIAVTLFSDEIIGLLYGPEFAPAATVLSVHIFGGVFLFIRTAVSRWLIVEELLIFSLVSHASGAAINVAFNLILIPKFGIVGAAWASVLSYAVSGFLFLLLSRRTRAMFWMIIWSALPQRWALTHITNLAALMAERRVE